MTPLKRSSRIQDKYAAFHGVLGIHLTTKCTATCRHCGVNGSPHRDERLVLELVLENIQAFAHRGVIKAVHVSGGELLPRLRDADFTKVLLVTLPEATPVHEAFQLQRDLERAEIKPYAWVINQSLTPLRLHDPVLLARRAGEAQYIEEVNQGYALRTALVPWASTQPDFPAWLSLLVSTCTIRVDC